MSKSKLLTMIYAMWKINAEHTAAVNSFQYDAGPVLRQYRKEERLTQRELADRLGVDYTYISKIENGQAEFSGALCVKVEKLLTSRAALASGAESESGK